MSWDTALPPAPILFPMNWPNEALGCLGSHSRRMGVLNSGSAQPRVGVKAWCVCWEWMIIQRLGRKVWGAQRLMGGAWPQVETLVLGRGTSSPGVRQSSSPEVGVCVAPTIPFWPCGLGQATKAL